MDHKFSNAYVPDQKLLDFLAAGDKPIFVGFGSMVINKYYWLLKLIIGLQKLINNNYYFL